MALRYTRCGRRTYQVIMCEKCGGSFAAVLSCEKTKCEICEPPDIEQVRLKVGHSKSRKGVYNNA